MASRPQAEELRSRIPELMRQAEEEAADRGLLREPGETCDPPPGRPTVLTKATTETYWGLIVRPGWVLAIYVYDSYTLMNYVHGRCRNYTSPRPAYRIAGSALTAARKLVRESGGGLAGVLVDIGRCAHESSWCDAPAARLYHDGDLIHDVSLARPLSRGEGPAGIRLSAWFHDVMSRPLVPRRDFRDRDPITFAAAMGAVARGEHVRRAAWRTAFTYLARYDRAHPHFTPDGTGGYTPDCICEVRVSPVDRSFIELQNYAPSSRSEAACDWQLSELAPGVRMPSVAFFGRRGAGKSSILGSPFPGEPPDDGRVE